VATEIELKLTIAPEDVGKIAKSALLAAATRSKPTTRTVYSVYYDTPERDIAHARHGAAPAQGGGHWVQTLKTVGTRQAGLHEREEFEAPAAAQLLNFVPLPRRPPPSCSPTRHCVRACTRCSSPNSKRTTRLIEIHPGELAELCVDRGTITSGSRQEVICRDRAGTETG